MRIVTAQFSLTKGEYFRIRFFSILQGYWFMFPIVFLICLLGLKMDAVSIISHIVLFVLISAVFLCYLIMICIGESLFLKENQLLLIPRTCELDHEFVTVQFVGGSLFKVSFAQILKTVVSKNYCLFYFANNDFIYLPFNSFTNPADIQVLMTLIKVKSS